MHKLSLSYINNCFSISGSLIEQPVMVDSDADANFMDTNIARKIGLEFVPLQNRLKTTSMEGALQWEVTHQTTPVLMHINQTIFEEISFYECDAQLADHPGLPLS